MCEICCTPGVPVRLFLENYSCSWCTSLNAVFICEIKNIVLTIILTSKYKPCVFNCIYLLQYLSVIDNISKDIETRHRINIGILKPDLTWVFVVFFSLDQIFETNYTVYTCQFFVYYIFTLFIITFCINLILQ